MLTVNRVDLGKNNPYLLLLAIQGRVDVVTGQMLGVVESNWN